MSNDKPDANAQLDPKERMRAALDAKKAAAHSRDAHAEATSKVSGGPQGKAAGKRVFRRKSGG